MPVQVVLRQVEQHSSRRLKAIATVKLKAGQLQHPHLRQRASVDVRGQGVEQRRADVAGHGHRAAGMRHGVCRERRHRGFAIGAGHGQQRWPIAVRTAQCFQRHGIQVQFASRAYPACAGSYQYRSNLGRTQTRRAVHGRHALSFDQAGIQGACDKAHLWQLLLQYSELRRRRAGVGHRHLGAAAHTPARHRQAGSAQAQDQGVLALQRQRGTAADRPASGYGRQHGKVVFRSAWGNAGMAWIGRRAAFCYWLRLLCHAIGCGAGWLLRRRFCQSGVGKNARHKGSSVLRSGQRGRLCRCGCC